MTGGQGAAAVRAVVVNWNAGPLLIEAVASLRSAGVTDVVVADNASVDGSTASLAAADPDVALVHTGANLGYGTGANRGADAPGDADRHLLICNPDLVVDPGAVKALVAVLDEQPDVAIVGPRLDNPDGSWYPSARRFPSMVDAIGHAFFVLVAPENRFTRRYRRLDVDPDQATDVDWVSGACFLIRRSAWDALGGFDEGYFMFLEEVDLCWRAHQAGWRVRYEPAARVVHVVGASRRRRPYRMLVAHHRSMWRYAQKTATGRDRFALPAIAAGLGVRLVVEVVQRAIRGDRAHLG